MTMMSYESRQHKGYNDDWGYGYGWEQLMELAKYTNYICVGIFNFFVRDGFITLLIEYYKRKSLRDS